MPWPIVPAVTRKHEGTATSSAPATPSWARPA